MAGLLRQRKVSHEYPGVTGKSGGIFTAASWRVTQGFRRLYHGATGGVNLSKPAVRRTGGAGCAGVNSGGERQRTFVLFPPGSIWQ